MRGSSLIPLANKLAAVAFCMAAVLTACQGNLTDESTPTFPPTSPPLPSPSPIPIGYAGYPVTANDQWEPVVQQFDVVEMVLVPAGCFTMGSTDEQIAAAAEITGQELSWIEGLAYTEQPASRICFDQPFWIDRLEVSNVQFAYFGGQAEHESEWDGDYRPRETISQKEAADFCQARGARLPTEAEWEYSARGPDNLYFPWGNEFVATYAIYEGNSDRHTWDVGERPGGASWVGALDMAGNVEEWVSSAYEPYPYGPDHEQGVEDGLYTGAGGAIRGGAWYSDNYDLRTASRNDLIIPELADAVGFRCVRSTTDPQSDMLTASAAPTARPSSTPTATPTSRPITPTAGPSPTAGPTPYPASDRIWYHDDRLIIYTRDNRLCALSGDDPPVFLAEAGWIPEWSPGIRVSSDGQLIAFIQRHAIRQPYSWDSLWVVGADGSGLRRLVNLADISTTQDEQAGDIYSMTVVFPHFTWIPGTHQIAFTTGTLSYQYYYNNDLNVADADTGSITTLLRSGSGGGSIYPSPDGHTIALFRYGTNIGDNAFDGPATISFINTDGTNWHSNVFTFEVRFLDNDLHYLSIRPIWTVAQNGIRIALPAEYPLQQESEEIVGWLIPADGSAPRVTVRVEPVKFDAMFGSGPALSPDGRYMMFAGEYQGEMGLHIIDTSTLEVTQSDPSGYRTIRWERDSMHYNYRASGEYPQTLVMQGDIGGEPVVQPSPEVPEQECIP
jgi:formylglycine-generating enzyme required for sulfatase activity